MLYYKKKPEVTGLHLTRDLPRTITGYTGDDIWHSTDPDNSLFVEVAGGTSPYSYKWEINGVLSNRITLPYYDINYVNTGYNGKYRCLISDSDNNQIWSSVCTITVSEQVRPA